MASNRHNATALATDRVPAEQIDRAPVQKILDRIGHRNLLAQQITILTQIAERNLSREFEGMYQVTIAVPRRRLPLQRLVRAK